MRKIWIILAAVLCMPALADVIILKDGSRVEGDVKRGEGGYDVKGGDGKITHVGMNQVASIQLGKTAGPGAAKDRLASLKRSSESIDDINTILARYKAFIE